MAIAHGNLHDDTARDPFSGFTRILGTDMPRRTLHVVALARAVLASGLVVIALFYREPSLLGTTHPALFALTAVTYGVLSWFIYFRQRRRPVLPAYLISLQLAIDIAAITLLMLASGGVRSGIGALLVVFTGAACLSLHGRQALIAAAVAALAILGQQLVLMAAGTAPPEDFVSAGVLGAIIFVVAATAWPMARRLAESEALAHQRGVDLANLAQLNDYIIQNLRESIVVVDEQDRLRLANQSAAERLGLSSRAPGQPLARAAPTLARLLGDWRSADSRLREPPPFVAADGSTRINTYIAPLGQGPDGPVLIFLEDAALLAEKVQQSKLAALGRLSASIAHEIRNPVGALSHAGQLLGESASVGTEERRFIEIIRNNAERVSGIVDSVLQLSRREASRPELILLDAWIEGFVAEFEATLELVPGQLRVQSADNEPVQVRMDPGHLRQVVWNLCENATRYGRAADGGLRIDLHYGRMAPNRRPYLEVADRGPGIAEELQHRLFEPFSTTRSGGTGLGLFISRELCECNRATLLHESRAGGGAIFRIVFADPLRWGGNG